MFPLSCAAARPRTGQGITPRSSFQLPRSDFRRRHMRDIRVMQIKPLDSGLLVWKVETGRSSSDIRRVSSETDFVVVLGDSCEKKIQA